MTTRPAADRAHPRWRAFWGLLIALLIVAETGALRRALVGDTLSETIWWAYGPALEPRWWFLGCTVGALLVWAAAHFMWPPIAWRSLLVMEAAALAVAFAGWMFTR